MAGVDVKLIVELPGFTPSAARAFVADPKRIEVVREEAAFRLRQSRDWAYDNVRVEGAEIRLREGETERYTIEEYGFNEWIVRDDEGEPGHRIGGIIAGPFLSRDKAEKVRDTLQAIEDEFTGLDEPEEDRGGDSGDDYDIPF